MMDFSKIFLDLGSEFGDFHRFLIISDRPLGPPEPPQATPGDSESPQKTSWGSKTPQFSQMTFKFR